MKEYFRELGTGSMVLGALAVLMSLVFSASYGEWPFWVRVVILSSSWFLVMEISRMQYRRDKIIAAYKSRYSPEGAQMFHTISDIVKENKLDYGEAAVILSEGVALLRRVEDYNARRVNRGPFPRGLN